MIGVLFICTGNICRSPTAEGVFRAMVARAGLESGFVIDSAGTYDGHVGQPPSREAVRAAARRGYDLAALRARQLVADDLRRFDHVLAMDRGHLRALRAMAPPDLKDKPRLFLDTAPHLGLQEVDDPWYGTTADYERALDTIEAGCAALLEHLRATSLTA
ncbi:low molecular weight protein-tyrosine-phosphatase [Vineibacter terrae]|uniref:protein-tyrosine-phosphatase n=1 Tax=Vineibacter terrae TaxID=2586908 RepID=A0A5C8PM36_9HYPH|nr:low molecular weight protein-tyrosine-phosphatase [Vineibacter terrae]TXL74818.1 low molecular weight phosphotyrosine protein phosphatase [Vineibacter terrae]HEX2886149.1 low molecular weight protein-tyrosine-phosphatase [Vineibacter terrae]